MEGNPCWLPHLCHQSRPCSTIDAPFLLPTHHIYLEVKRHLKHHMSQIEFPASDSQKGSPTQKMAPPCFPLPGPTHSLIVDPSVSLSHTHFPQTNLVIFKIRNWHIYIYICHIYIHIYIYTYIYIYICHTHTRIHNTHKYSFHNFSPNIIAS